MRHPTLARAVASLGAIALLLVSLPASASATPSAVNYSTPGQARKAYEAAQAHLISGQTRLTLAQQERATAQLMYTNAATRLATAKLNETATYQASVEKQEDVDTLARTMYMGEAASTMDLLFVNSSDNFPLALTTHNYLTSVADSSILSSSDATTAYIAAQEETASASLWYQQAQLAFTAAEADVTDALNDVTQARTEVESSANDYRDFLINYTPVTDEPLLDPTVCGDWLVRKLYEGGYRNEDLREAWAIAMRESGGRDDAISASGDYGIFQINKATYGTQTWWDTEALLTKDYNIRIAYYLSQGGKTWISWGLDGHGRANAVFYERSGWSMQRIDDHIVKPFEKWYNLYPCVDKA